MNKLLSIVLEIIGWGLIIVAILFILLKLFGIIHSPAGLTLDSMLTAGILSLLVETRVKLGLIWSDFKKRKDI